MTHHIHRIGPRPVVLRRLTVRSVERLTPRYARITFEGADLAGFESGAPDDHVKLFFPDANTGALDASNRSRMRDFTPRKFDGDSLIIDFALHGAGIANQWAENARPGSQLLVGGPRGSTVVPYDFDWYLLAGDETAIPAISRRLEELPKNAKVKVFLEVDTEADEQRLAGDVTWLHRRGGEGLLAKALAETELPTGDGFVFVAGESGDMKTVREVLERRGHKREWSRVTGYWKRGVADFHEGH